MWRKGLIGVMHTSGYLLMTGLMLVVWYVVMVLMDMSLLLIEWRN